MSKDLEKQCCLIYIFIDCWLIFWLLFVKSFVILRASSIWLLALWLIFIWNDKIQYEKRGQSWNKVVRSSLSDWNRNLTTIVEWSPYDSEEDLLKQVSLLFSFYFTKKKKIVFFFGFNFYAFQLFYDWLSYLW